MAKQLEIKDWMWNKIAEEHHVPSVWGGNVDVVFAETEKAYKVIIGAVNYTVITWVPKSQCSWVESNEATKTYVCDSYESAMEQVKAIRDSFC